MYRPGRSSGAVVWCGGIRQRRWRGRADNNVAANDPCCDAQQDMRFAVVDQSAGRAAVIHEGLAALDDWGIFVVRDRRGLVARIGEIALDSVLIDLGNPSRDVLEGYFAVRRALARPIAMFVDDSDAGSVAASVEAGVSAYDVDGMAPHRIRLLLELAVSRFNAFARLQADLVGAKGKLADPRPRAGLRRGGRAVAAAGEGRQPGDGARPPAAPRPQ